MDWPVGPTYCIPQLISVQIMTYIRSDEVQTVPFSDDVMIVLVHKCVQQIHLLALHLETLGLFPHLFNALIGLVYFLIIGNLK